MAVVERGNPLPAAASVLDGAGAVFLPTEVLVGEEIVPSQETAGTQGSWAPVREEQWGRKGLFLGGGISSAKQNPLLPSSLLCDHRPDTAAEDQIHGEGTGCEHHSGAAVVVGHATGHGPAAGGPPVSPGTLPSCPDCPEL